MDNRQAVQSLNGLLLVNKPTGPTTYDLIRWLKRSIAGAKIGHCGTLDPFASGLVILLLGKATKRQAELMGKNKTYRCQIQFGIKTDSGDLTGKVINRIDKKLDSDTVRKVLETFIGPQTQIPPMYSALKVNGQPLYKLARKGQVIERKERAINIFSIDFLNFNENILEFRTEVTSGTYIRTLAEDIGEKLDHCATTFSLVRESIENFKLSEAIDGEQLSKMNLEMIKNVLKGF